jgi:hypothetical protein
MIWAPLLFFFAVPEPETADTIMARVAANQDRAESARSSFVYHQNVMIRMNYTNGKLAREEYSEFTVTPTSHGIKKQRTHFLGKYRDHGKLVEYREPKPDMHVHIVIDEDVVSDLSEELAGDKQTKDGIVRDLFPLTAKEQSKYVFRLDGTEDYRGTTVYRVFFEPKGEGDWAGEALIDLNEFQPVLITTHQAFKIPLLVKTALGTNVEHCGFKVTYKKFDDGLWFPVTYGGELRLRLLFFYARRIGVSMQNSGFQRADVSSKVNFATVE